MNNFIKKSLLKNILSLIIIFGICNFQIENASAEYTNLTPCKESATFQKRLNSSIKKLENRLKFYSADSSEEKAILKEIEATKLRFDKYKNSDLLCGKEGFPRIIATGEFKYINQFVIPGILFIYTTGWIGWVGRKYIHYAQSTENPFENEIIINVPKALSIMNSGFLWPVDAWKEFISGNLLEVDEKITKSPR